MKAKDLVSGLGTLFGGVALLVLFAGMSAVFLFGAAWASNTLLPWFTVFTGVAFAIVVLVLLPLAIPRTTRGFSSVALFIASYLFGATLWMEGFLLTLSLWGVFGVFVGLFMGGVGVVPVAMLATIIKGLWAPLIELVVLTIMTFASRIGATALAASLEE
jgi:hypothetical protein